MLIENLVSAINGDGNAILKNKTNGAEIPVVCELSERAKEIVTAGGLLNFTKKSM